MAAYKKYESIAANSEVSQSSVYHISSSHVLNAGRATDGNVDGILGHLSCSMTRKENYPWWKVVFKHVTRVNGVYIASRTDCCRKCLNTGLNTVVLRYSSLP